MTAAIQMLEQAPKIRVLWHPPTAPSDQVDRLVDAKGLWDAWGKENGELGADINAFVDEYLRAITGGSVVIVVAYVGHEPAGMVTLHRNYDSVKSRTRVWGERLYVLQKHRKSTVFRALWKAAMEASIAMGAKEQVISCPVGAKQQAFYERAGFVPSDVILKREVAP
jgi:GNAT superfamily N-acetyltransferase